jgi:hypothetical protein
MNKFRKIILITLIFIVFTVFLFIPSSNHLPILYSTHTIYIPVVYTTRFFVIENEGVNWTLLHDYYLNKILAFSVNAGQLQKIGWNYFDNKYIHHTGKIVLKLKGANQEWADPTCKPIPTKFWDNWIQEFAVVVIDHIGSDKIIVVELGNEPDTDFSLYEYFFGCWGTTYAEGQYYAEFINFVYPILKAEYPNIEFIAGAFMNPYSDFADGVASTLKNIDGISFHYYPDCSDTYTKLESIISLMDSMFVFPLYFSETNLVYATKTTLCDQKQAEYIHYLRTLKNLRMIVIYTAGCNTWKNADLIYPCSPITLKPAYWEFMGQSQMTEFPIPPP